MNSLLVGTWSLISSEEVLSRARKMTQRIQGFLEQNTEELSPEELSLLGLQKRVESLVPSLNFLLAQTLGLDSCVQQVVQNTQDLLIDVCSFVERSCPEKSGGANSLDSELLDHYLHELEFGCLSVTMAMNVLHAASAEAAGPCLVEMRENTPLRSGVSLECLLNASQRIQDLYGRTGDLSTSRGQLFHQGNDGTWAMLMSFASLSVRSDEALGYLRYSLHLAEAKRPGPEELDVCLPLDFRIEVALAASLGPVAELPGAAEGSEALFWQGGSFGLSVAACEFPDAQLVLEDDGASPKSRSFWQRRRQQLLSAGLSPGEVAQGSSSYAFVFHESGDGELGPQEVLYMARLCAFDTGHQQFQKLDTEERCSPPHLQSSDELLTLLTG